MYNMYKFRFSSQQLISNTQKFVGPVAHSV